MSMLRSLATNMAAVASGKAMTAVAGLLMIMVLTRHLGELARRALRSVGGEDAVSLSRQVEMANLRALTGCPHLLGGRLSAVLVGVPGDTDITAHLGQSDRSGLTDSGV